MQRTWAQPSWHYLRNRGLDTTHTLRLEDVYFLDSNLGFAVNLNSEIFKTTDGGYRWYIKNKLPDTVSFRSIEFLDNGRIGIAGSLDNHLFRTADGGETWTNISSAVIDQFNQFPSKSMCGLSHFGSTF